MQRLMKIIEASWKELILIAIMALMGYELIEGYISGGTLYERQRANGLDLVRADVRQMIDKTGEQPVGN